eukprot:m.178474 g.178474  ORF g.178474 m.178474 type:complete len:304 (+) comp14551_c0_seq1:150-1061(+)
MYSLRKRRCVDDGKIIDFSKNVTVEGQLEGPSATRARTQMPRLAAPHPVAVIARANDLAIHDQHCLGIADGRHDAMRRVGGKGSPLALCLSDRPRPVCSNRKKRGGQHGLVFKCDGETHVEPRVHDVGRTKVGGWPVARVTPARRPHRYHLSHDVTAARASWADLPRTHLVIPQPRRATHVLVVKRLRVWDGQRSRWRHAVVALASRGERRDGVHLVEPQRQVHRAVGAHRHRALVHKELRRIVALVEIAEPDVQTCAPGRCEQAAIQHHGDVLGRCRVRRVRPPCTTAVLLRHFFNDHGKIG